ncbi:MAG TPA: DUF4070 domain-containing protein [Candidatus Krumholzibacteria bacterium]|nr:DUF4070 domain-containing protein [Candidatus Krumholzibacteria bacterium]
MNVLLVSPETPDTFWSFAHALPFVSKRATHPPLGLLTVAAMLPDEWELRLVDLDVEPLRDEHIDAADVVFLGGMIVHRESAHEIAHRCHVRGRTVIAGGPLFTTGHEGFPEIDHFCLGEAEDVIERLVADLEAGTLQRFYEPDGFPCLDHTPVPRWDLLDLDRYATMSVQFSRGCPHDCEFCDVVVMNGHVPRTKTPEHMIAELEALHRAGWRRDVFVVDDNFIGNRRKTRQFLRALIDWRERTGIRMDFLTEATVDLAQSTELLALMVRAGFKKVFLGIETPDQDALRECHKLQNVRTDLEESVRILQNAGLEVMGGFIVGFDHDQPDVFQRQFAFIQRTGVVTAMVGLLNALPRTKLYQRLKREGRLLSDSAGNNTDAFCNFVPKLDRDTLESGYRQLMKRLYEPQVFYERAKAFLRNYRPHGPRRGLRREDVAALFRSMWVLGLRDRGRRAYWGFLAYALVRHRRAFAVAVTLAIHGYHFRRVARGL